MNPMDMFRMPTGGPPELVMEYLERIFGAGPFGELARALNAGMLLLYAIFLTYITLTSVMMTASTGKTIGDERGTWVLAPRLLFGAVILVPLNTGWSAGQMAVFEMAKMGLGFGSSIWAEAQNRLPGTIATAISERPADEQLRRLVVLDFEQQLCVYEVNRQFAAMGGSPPAQMTEMTNSAGTETTWVMNRPSLLPTRACGSWTWPRADERASAVTRAVILAQRDAFLQVVRPRTQQAANAIVNGAGDEAAFWQLGAIDLAQIDQITDAYRTRLANIAAQTISSTIASVSWSNAGARFNMVAREVAAMHRAILSLPAPQSPDWQNVSRRLERMSRNDPGVVSRVDTYRSIIGQAMDGVRGTTTQTATAPSTGRATGENGASESAEGRMAQLMNGIAARLSSMTYQPDPGESPLSRLVLIGHRMMDAGLAGFGLLAAGGLVPTITVAPVLASLFGPLIVALITAGALLAFVLPITAYATYYLAVVGWVILVVTTAIAVPVWALAHVRGGSDGLIPSSAQAGWIALLRVFITPPMMIVALVFAVSVTEFSAGLLLSGFGVAFQDATAGHPIMFLGYIIAAIVAVYLLLQVYWRAFNLMRDLPETVLTLALGSSGVSIRDSDGRSVIAAPIPTPGLPSRMPRMSPPAGGGGGGNGGRDAPFGGSIGLNPRPGSGGSSSSGYLPRN